MSRFPDIAEFLGFVLEVWADDEGVLLSEVRNLPDVFYDGVEPTFYASVYEGGPAP